MLNCMEDLVQEMALEQKVASVQEVAKSIR